MEIITLKLLKQIMLEYVMLDFHILVSIIIFDLIKRNKLNIYIIIIIHLIINLEGCKYIKDLKLEECKYINNNAIPHLSLLQDSLTNLEIIRCKSIDDNGLRELKILKYVVYVIILKTCLKKI